MSLNRILERQCEVLCAEDRIDRMDRMDRIDRIDRQDRYRAQQSDP